MPSACYHETSTTLDMPSTTQRGQKENVGISKRWDVRAVFLDDETLICCRPRRKNRGRRCRKQTSSSDRRSRCWDKSSTHEPLLDSSRNSLSSERGQATYRTDVLVSECFSTPVKGHQHVRTDVSSPGANRAPFRPLNVIANPSRPPFLSPLCSPRKSRDAGVAKPVRAMMDVFLDSRARSSMEDESDDESFRDIGRRLGISKFMRTPESPTPPSSRASSLGMDGAFSTPTRSSMFSSSKRTPRRRSGFYLLRAQESQESPLKMAASTRAKKSWALATQREGFWRREAERLRMRAPKILLPSWHLGLAGQEDGEDTERLMTLAEVSLADLELDVSELDLGPPEHLGFEVSGDRSTVDW